VAKRHATEAATGKEEEEEEQKAEAMRAEMRETVICFIFASTYVFLFCTRINVLDAHTFDAGGDVRHLGCSQDLNTVTHTI